MLDFTLKDFLDPPGCMAQLLDHPTKNNQCLNFALFNEHRFAFYYWIKWSIKHQENPPTLITFDWHQDLGHPLAAAKEELKKSNIEKAGEVAFYTWARLDHSNDCQIGYAAYLNKVKDVYAICRQGNGKNSTQKLVDYRGNVHNIFIFPSVEAFEISILKLGMINYI